MSLAFGGSRHMRRLTDILEQMRAVTRVQVQTAVGIHCREGRPIGACLVETRACTEEIVVKALSTQLGVPWVRVDNMQIPPDITGLIHREIAVWHAVLPLGIWLRQGKRHPSLHVAMSRPTDREAIEHLAKLTGYAIEPLLAGDLEIQTAIQRCYGGTNRDQEVLASAAMDDWIDLETED